MENKRMFQILDEMNLSDVENNTQLVKISNSLISADKVKQGAKISMGADVQSFFDLASDNYIPILVMVDKKEYFKRKQNGK